MTKPKLLVTLCARFSADKQRDASIADQLRLCRLRAKKEGWTVVEEYTDHAISGSPMILRPGIQALITDSSRGRFDMILAEAMDRLLRDQEDIAAIFKRMTYADVKMFTLTEGEVTEMLIGMKGTMNQIGQLIARVELVPVSTEEAEILKPGGSSKPENSGGPEGNKPGLTIHLHGALASLLRLACGLPVHEIVEASSQMQKAPRKAGRGGAINGQSIDGDIASH